MGRHLDYGAVPKEAFRAMLRWLEDVWSKSPSNPDEGNPSSRSKQKYAKEWLGKLATSEWPEKPGEYKTYLCSDEVDAEYYSTLSTQARSLLIPACEALGFRYCAQTMQDGLEFRVAWDSFERVGIDRPAGGTETTNIKRIAWVQVPYQCAFTDLVLLGATSMAGSLGLDLQIHAAKSSGKLFETTQGIAKGIERRLGAEDARNSTAFVLELADVSDATLSKHHHLRGYRVINTGMRGSLVAQDDASIGIQLADAALAGHSSSSLCRIGIIAANKAFTPGGNLDRVVAFEKCVDAAASRASRTKYHVERIGVDFGDHLHPHELCSRLQSKRGGDGIVDLDAVFTVSGDIAEWLVPMLHNVPKGKVPKVFSADLTPALINLMCEPNSPLEAICGVCPYSYGQLIVRAACNTGLTKPIEARPVRLGREEMMNAGIRSLTELISKYSVLQMNDDEFAWQAWMR